MKNFFRVLSIFVFVFFCATAVFASGNKEEPAQNTPAQNAGNASTGSAGTGASAASTGSASASNKNTGKLYTVLPAGTDGSAGKTGKYVLFGEWPQTIKAEGVTVNKSKSRQQGAFTYYLGSDGAWYYEAEEHSYDYYEYGDAYLGIECSYSDGSARQIYDWDQPSTRFFKVEPIKWRVLTTNYQGKMLLLAEDILTAGIAYNENYRADEYPNDYESSTIRAYLNGIPYTSLYITPVSWEEDEISEEENDEYVGVGFLQTAFNADEQKSIAVTEVDNSLEQCYELGEEIPELLIENRELMEFDNDNTQDKVFLLSVKEIAQYTNTEALERIEPTDFALANGAFFFQSWWLRSPMWIGAWADYDGVIDYDDLQLDYVRKIVYGDLKTEYGGYGDSVDGYDYDDNCLVPAICIAK